MLTMYTIGALLLLTWVSLAAGRVILEKGPFLKLPNGAGQLVFNAGTASKASYDPLDNMLYVIGHKADVVHVINMTDPKNPVRLFTKAFNSVTHGLPNAIKVCRTADGRTGLLAISFESASLTGKGHVHFHGLLNAGNMHNYLDDVLDAVATESYDPRSLAWQKDCSQLVVASEGDPHELNGVFQDPVGDLEVLIPAIGSTVQRRDIPISETKAEAANVRHVFTRCDSGSGQSQTSSLQQDLEPSAVHVDKNNTAYIVFQENNAIASLDLSDPFAEMKFFSLGTKDWSKYQFDGSYEDNGIKLKSRKLVSFYQPRDLISFELDGKTWLATADTGAIRRYALTSCKFDESATAYSWRQQFSDGLTAEEVTQLKAEMSSNAELGRLYVSKLKTLTDGWDPVYQGYDFVSMFGGRGFSILDPVDMTRVYDSGDDFERYFITPEATQSEKVLFNSYMGRDTEPQSTQFDKRSVVMGPEPTAITTGEMNWNTKVLVVANGPVGGLYTYTVTQSTTSHGAPVVHFESYTRRGQAGLSWRDAYNEDSDAVGEPSTSDLLFIDDQGQKTVVAVSEMAGAVSFYTVKVV